MLFGLFELNGGAGRNRTGVHGVAVRCMTTLPPRHRFLATSEAAHFTESLTKVTALFDKSFIHRLFRQRTANSNGA